MDLSSGFLLTHEIWDDTSAALLPTSISLGWWCWNSEQQRLIVLHLAKQRICMDSYSSAFLAELSCFFSCSRTIACNQCWERICLHWTLCSRVLIEVCFFAPYLCWNTAETPPSCSKLLAFSSFSHDLTFYSLWGNIPEPYGCFPP